MTEILSYIWRVTNAVYLLIMTNCHTLKTRLFVLNIFRQNRLTYVDHNHLVKLA